MIETRLIRLVRERQAVEAEDADVELITDVVRDVLPDVLQEPAVQDAIAQACAVGELRAAKRHHPTARGARRA